MGRDLDQVVARVRVRRREGSGEAIVYELARFGMA
jgi:hypothetical protein